MNRLAVDPWTWLVVQDGAYWTDAARRSPIDPTMLVLPTLAPRKPKAWAPSFEGQHGIIGERLAVNRRGAS